MPNVLNTESKVLIVFEKEGVKYSLDLNVRVKYSLNLKEQSEKLIVSESRE